MTNLLSKNRPLDQSSVCFTHSYSRSLLFANLSYVFLKNCFQVGLCWVQRACVGRATGRTVPAGPTTCQFQDAGDTQRERVVSVLLGRTPDQRFLSRLPRRAASLAQELIINAGDLAVPVLLSENLQGGAQRSVL